MAGEVPGLVPAKLRLDTQSHCTPPQAVILSPSPRKESHLNLDAGRAMVARFGSLLPDRRITWAVVELLRLCCQSFSQDRRRRYLQALKCSAYTAQLIS